MNRFFSHIGSRSLVRWAAASLIGVVSVSQALRALPGMLARSASLGAFALSALALLTIAGMASLWFARLRIGRELFCLGQHPATGQLVEARRSRLTTIAARGGKPDRGALAEAASAEERGQAYLGRFLVAVAVLIGLVGTFSGLAEALRGLPAILNGAASDPQKLAGLLAAPLSGLDVTFAAGIVGILSTLALALAQGDLQIHEELALARLEEETTHELIPALWPVAHSVEERMVRELVALREENRGMLLETGNSIGAHVAAATAKSTTELVARLGSAVEQSGKALAEAVELRFAEQLSALQKTAETEHSAQRDRSERLLKQLADNSKVLEQRFVSETSAQTAALREAGRTQTAALQEAAQAQVKLADELRTRSEASATLQSAQLQALQAELASQAELTQHTLTTAATRGHAESTLAWQALRATLGTEVSGLRDTLHRQIDGAREALSETATSVVTAMQTSGEQTQARLTALQVAAVEALSQGSLEAQCAIAEAAEQSSRALADGARALTEAAAVELGQTRTALVLAANQASESLSSALIASNDRLETLLGSTRSDLTDTLQASREAVDRLVTESVGALNTSCTSLAQSSERLAFVADALTPQLEALSPELHALGQEVALLGTRQQDHDQPLFADELLRLGEGMERLEALVRLGQPTNDGPLGEHVIEGAKG